jgi:glycosyltransferase involved in cell wall biosynthesis
MKDAMIGLGIAADKIRVINFGTDTTQFSPGVRNSTLATTLGVAECPTVISLRSLQQLYDVQTLVRAAPIVLDKEPKAKFIVAGDGPERAKLTEMAQELGVAQSVRFVGSVPNEELPEYLRLADVYVSTALEDGGIAASTAEAMACALPVVITDFGDNRDWVEDGVSGYLVKLSDPQMLAERIVELFRRDELRKEFGARGRRVIQERNDWETEMGKAMSLYREVSGEVP